MHFGVIPFRKSGDSVLQPDWKGQLGQWRRLVRRCSRKPGRGSVHALRVATLRVETELEVWLRGCPARNAAARAARRWIRQAERLRTVLSPVRDADVFREVLAGLGGFGEAAPAAAAPEGLDCLRGIARLNRRLERRRIAAGKKLVRALAVREEQLDRAGRELAQALAGPGATAVPDWAAALRSLLAALAAEAPNLSADSLHEFRKRAKSARYLAELVAPHNPVAVRQTAQCKAIQQSAGAWHDWQAMADEAEHSGAPNALKGLLASVAERSLAEALTECQRIAVQLMPLRAQAETPRSAPTRRPVRRVEPAAVFSGSLSA